MTRFTILLFLVPLLAANSAPNVQSIPPQYSILIHKYCAETGVPVYIATNMATEESGWDPVSDNGVAGGLFQLNYTFHSEFQKKYNNGKPFSEFDPEPNVRIALRYLAALHKRFGTWRKALYYYNCGYSEGVVKSVRELVNRELGSG